MTSSKLFEMILCFADRSKQRHRVSDARGSFPQPIFDLLVKVHGSQKWIRAHFKSAQIFEERHNTQNREDTVSHINNSTVVVAIESLQATIIKQNRNYMQTGE
jgi:hypothetical protein